jgi:hypothetical protein
MSEIRRASGGDGLVVDGHKGRPGSQKAAEPFIEVKKGDDICSLFAKSIHARPELQPEPGQDGQLLQDCYGVWLARASAGAVTKGMLLAVPTRRELDGLKSEAERLRFAGTIPRSVKSSLFAAVRIAENKQRQALAKNPVLDALAPSGKPKKLGRKTVKVKEREAELPPALRAEAFEPVAALVLKAAAPRLAAVVAALSSRQLEPALVGMLVAGIGDHTRFGEMLQKIGPDELEQNLGAGLKHGLRLLDEELGRRGVSDQARSRLREVSAESLASQVAAQLELRFFLSVQQRVVTRLYETFAPVQERLGALASAHDETARAAEARLLAGLDKGEAVGARLDVVGLRGDSDLLEALCPPSGKRPEEAATRVLVQSAASARLRTLDETLRKINLHPTRGFDLRTLTPSAVKQLLGPDLEEWGLDATEFPFKDSEPRTALEKALFAGIARTSSEATLTKALAEAMDWAPFEALATARLLGGELAAWHDAQQNDRLAQGGVGSQDELAADKLKKFGAPLVEAVADEVLSGAREGLFAKLASRAEERLAKKSLAAVLARLPARLIERLERSEALRDRLVRHLAVLGESKLKALLGGKAGEAAEAVVEGLVRLLDEEHPERVTPER